MPLFEEEFIVRIFPMDSSQHHPKYIKNILNALKFHDACYTNYKKRKHKMWKRFVSWLNNIITSILLDKPFRVYLSSLEVLTKMF